MANPQPSWWQSAWELLKKILGISDTPEDEDGPDEVRPINPSVNFDAMPGNKKYNACVWKVYSGNRKQTTVQIPTDVTKLFKLTGANSYVIAKPLNNLSADGWRFGYYGIDKDYGAFRAKYRYEGMAGEEFPPVEIRLYVKSSENVFEWKMWFNVQVTAVNGEYKMP